jgi:hypothetical protein
VGSVAEPPPPPATPKRRPRSEEDDEPATAASRPDDGAPRKKKKKKKKKKEAAKSYLPIILMVSMIAVAGLFGVGFLAVRSLFTPTPVDPQEAIVELKKVGAFLTHDETLPDRPVIEVRLDRGSKDGDLAWLKAFPQLKKLELNGSSVDNLGLLHLKSLKNLEYLDCSGTNVTGGELDDITGLTNLKELHLNNLTLLREEYLEPLKKLPNLQVLSVRNCPFKPTGRSVKAVLPNLKIYNDVDDDGRFPPEIRALMR